MLVDVMLLVVMLAITGSAQGPAIMLENNGELMSTNAVITNELYRMGWAAHQNYLDEIIRYQIDTIHKQGMTKTEYLSMIKPYALWDIRPQRVAEVKWQNQTLKSGSLPDILWGYVGTRAFRLPKEEIFYYPQDFLRNAHLSAAAAIKAARADFEEIEHLVSLVKQSTNSLFVWQDWLKSNAYNRVNDVFRRGKTYWRYTISDGSPYPMSPQIEVLKDFHYSFQDELVFSLCKKVFIICVVKQNDCVILMTGGMTASSCGYIWADSQPTDEILGCLFHLSQVDIITNNLYYYVSSGPHN